MLTSADFYTNVFAVSYCSISDITELIESPLESSSGIASDSPTWLRPPSSSNSSLSTYKFRSSSPDTDEARSNRLNPGYASSSSSNDMIFDSAVPQHFLTHEARLLSKNYAYSPIVAGAAASTLTPPPPQQWRDSPYDIILKKKGRMWTSIANLPDEAMLNIFSYLPTNHLCRCARVCTRWYNLVWEPSLWTKIQINDENLNIDKALKLLLRRLSYETPHVCLTLESMNLKQCVRLSDKGLHLISKRCPELRQLELNGCRNITNNALCEVVSRCINLQHLNVTGQYLNVNMFILFYQRGGLMKYNNSQKAICLLSQQGHHKPTEFPFINSQTFDLHTYIGYTPTYIHIH